MSVMAPTLHAAPRYTPLLAGIAVIAALAGSAVIVVANNDDAAERLHSPSAIESDAGVMNDDSTAAMNERHYESQSVAAKPNASEDPLVTRFGQP